MGYSYSKRLEVIGQKREKLERQLAELNQQGKQISARERETKRKELNRKKYKWGGLVELAQQTQNRTISDEVLLGALLQVLKISDQNSLERWQQAGANLLKTQRKTVKESAAAQGYTQVDVRSE
jgi:hypothetical protein